MWIENSWGTAWGNNGWAELSWDFVTRYATEVASIVPLSPLERFYDSYQSVFDKGKDTHWVTTNLTAVALSFDDYTHEATLGGLFASPQPGTVPLYGCEADTDSSDSGRVVDHFVSLGSTCEGRIVLGLEGYLYSSPPASVPTVHIYRCHRTVNGHGDHFVSPDPHCEGYTTESSLGYLHA